jgi:hypothetical protein
MDKKSHRLTPARAALVGLALAALPMASFAFVSVGISVNIAPPALPVYVQPPCPAVGYIWTPGYWAYDEGDYYWVPGTWVTAPTPGFLWTPGYWGWGGGAYLWHAGYWGPHVGFYGGVNYGYGYGGVGFEGGYWRGGAFYYNRSVSNLGGVHVTNVYNKTVINNVNVTRVSFNGGEGGVHARPNSHELAAEHDHHVAFTSMQRDHEHAASGNHDLRASVNGGKPRIAATERPGVFSGRGVVAARAGAPYHGGNDHGGPGRGADVHAADHGGPGRGPDVHAADHGGAGRGGPDHVAARSDRPPGAGGSAEVRGGTGGGPGHGSELHGGGPGGAGHTDVAHAAGGRNDRPQGAGGVNTGGSGHSQPSHVDTARNDHAGSAGGAPNRTVQPHVNQANQMHNAPQPQGPRPGGSAQPTPHQSGGGGGGRGGGQPGPRPQAAPQPQSAPHPQNAPRPENHRGGGEPHGQGRPQGPQGRGGQNEPSHGRR